MQTFTNETQNLDYSLCQNCRLRPGTETWVGELGILAAIRGMAVQWCKICCLEAQLLHAQERARAIPELEIELTKLKDKDK